MHAVRYIVLGCGAIGGTVAAGLVRDGHDVLVCDADPAVVAAVSSAGLRIEGPVEQFTAQPKAVLPADLPGQIDGPGPGRGQGPSHPGRSCRRWRAG